VQLHHFELENRRALVRRHRPETYIPVRLMTRSSPVIAKPNSATGITGTQQRETTATLQGENSQQYKAQPLKLAITKIR